MSEKHNTNFRQELAALINRHSMENGSNTPDFILADYLVACLGAYETAVRQRQNWYDPVGLSHSPRSQR